jgi:hypothetical protein
MGTTTGRSERDLSEALEDLEHIAGGELLIQAYRDIERAEYDSESVLLVTLYRTRLARLGYMLPELPTSPLPAKPRLYEVLEQTHPDPYSAFKSIERRLLKLFTHLEFSQSEEDETPESTAPESDVHDD